MDVFKQPVLDAAVPSWVVSGAGESDGELEGLGVVSGVARDRGLVLVAHNLKDWQLPENSREKCRCQMRSLIKGY